MTNRLYVTDQFNFSACDCDIPKSGQSFHISINHHEHSSREYKSPKFRSELTKHISDPGTHYAGHFNGHPEFDRREQEVEKVEKGGQVRLQEKSLR